MNKKILRYAEPDVVFRTGSFYYPIIVNRNYFFVICPRKEVKVVFSRGVFFIYILFLPRKLFLCYTDKRILRYAEPEVVFREGVLFLHYVH